jgi:hypothetical protein
MAQSEVGGASLNGAVTDQTGAAVAGAKVSVINRDTKLERSTTTSETGLYNMVRLPVGRYDLTIEFQGFKSAKKQDIPLSIGAVATFDVKLEVGSASESVTVTAEAPVIESTRSQTSTAVNEKAVRDLPINGRNFLDFTVLTPGVVRDPRGGDLSFGGQRGTANSLLVDGGDSNNLFFGQSSGRGLNECEKTISVPSGDQSNGGLVGLNKSPPTLISPGVSKRGLAGCSENGTTYNR